jgi:hypothetical protein
VFVVKDTKPTDGPIPELSAESSLFASLMSSSGPLSSGIDMTSGEPVSSAYPTSSNNPFPSSSDDGPEPLDSEVMSSAPSTSMESAVKYVLCISSEDSTDPSDISDTSSEPDGSSDGVSTAPSTASSGGPECAEAIPIRVLISVASLADMFYIPTPDVEAGELYRADSITLTFKSRIQMEHVISLVCEDIKINARLQKLDIPAFEEVELSDSVDGQESSSEQIYLFP